MAIHLRRAADPVTLFLKRNTFRCKPLNADLTPEQCKERQLREVETKYFGRKLIVNNTPFDAWCRSGCCETGLIYLRKLAYKAYLTRVKERRKKKAAPCKPLGDNTCAVR